jgi:hypothetical protein
MNSIEEYFKSLFKSEKIDWSFDFDPKENKLFLNIFYEPESSDVFYNLFAIGFRKFLVGKVVLTTCFVCEAGLDIIVSEGDVFPLSEQMRIVSDNKIALEIKEIMIKHRADIIDAITNSRTHSWPQTPQR